jgi:hypothetical protein
MNNYKHTQTGYFIIIPIAVFIVFALISTTIIGFNLFMLLTVLLLVFCLALFSTLTVTVSNNFLEINFTFGFIRRKVLLNDIKSSAIVKNPWYYGWGIHFTRNGILFNVSGFSAVEIIMTGGKKYRIGTDDPEKLNSIIQENLSGKI